MDNPRSSVRLPCIGARWVDIILTAQWSIDGHGVPWKCCSKCGLARPAISFIKRVVREGQLGIFVDAKECAHCEPPEPCELVYDSGAHLTMRSRLHTDSGMVLKVFDRSIRQEVPMEAVGMRQMGREKNGIIELRFQPYSDRQATNTRSHNTLLDVMTQ